MTKENTLSELKTLSNNLGQIVLSKKDLELNNMSLNKKLYSGNLPETASLKFEGLNKSLVPLLHQYKNLQKVYSFAVNKGGCFITISGKCNGDISKSRHPYFFDLLQQDSLDNCTKKRDKWRDKCNNDDVTSLYIDKDNTNIYKKTDVIREQLNSLSCKIIKILIDMKPLVKDIQSFENNSAYNDTKQTLMDSIDKMMKQQNKSMKQYEVNGDPVITNLHTNYIKYIYSVCLVIFLLVVIIFGFKIRNFLLIEIVIIGIFVYIFWDNIKYYIFKFINKNLF